MATRTDRVQVIFEVGNDGKLKASLLDVGKAGDSAARGMDTAAASSERLQIRAVALGTVMGDLLGRGINALGRGFLAVIQSTMEAERVDAQLEARLRSTAGAAGMTKQALDELATATARKTTFDDESVKSAEAMLLTFTKVHADVFPKAIAAITDMAVAMGTDLESATLQLGKALNDPIQGISALQRVGVSFTADQKAVIKSLVETGRTAEAQVLILRELETEFGGAAEAARETFGGAVQALQNSLGDLLEGEGGSLDGATQAINDLTDTMNDPEVKAGFASLTSGLADVAGWAVRAAAEVGGVIAALRDYYGETSKQSLNVLVNRRYDVEAALARAEQRSGQGISDANDPIGKLFGRASGKDGKVAALTAELAAIDQRISELRAASAPKNSFAPGYERASLTFNPNPKPANAKPDSTSAGRASKMPDFYAATVADIKREIEEAARLDDRWKSLAATLAGPLASAEYEHQQNLREIETLGKQAGATSQQLAAAKEQETARYREEAEAIRDRLDPTRELIANMEFELGLSRLTNDEREREIALRQAGAGATEEQRQRVTDLVKQIQQAREEDAFKRDLKDLFVDIGMDVDNASDALEHFFDTLKRRALQALAENLIGKLFPPRDQAPAGGGGGASGGGWLDAIGTFVAGIFGGGRASGGSVSGGSLYEVVERGQPEVFEQNGKRYLIPGGAGWVSPAQPLAASGGGGGAAGGYAAVTINNYGPANGVRTEERTGPGGMRELLVFVQETAVNAVAADVQKGGKVAKAGQGAYGWQRQGVVRG